MLAPFFPGIQRKLLDFRATNCSVQIVVQAVSVRQAEETCCQSLKLTGAQGFGATGLFVTAVEQPIDVLLDERIKISQ